MKVSRAALQEYFKTPLPLVAEIADAFTFHAFEIDSIEGDVLDVKVLPNRAHDCTSVAAIAKELSAILSLPLKASEAGDFTILPPISLTLARLNGILGAEFSAVEVENVFKRLGLLVEMQGDTFVVTPPSDRVDVTLPEDLAEEVGRILGYDRVESKELPPPGTPPDQSRYRGIERMKDSLVAEGFTEVSTQSFATKGDVTLANPLDVKKPKLRTTLLTNLMDALERAKKVSALVLGPNKNPKLFEVGTVFPEGGEFLELRMNERVPAWGETVGTFDNLSIAKLEDYGKNYAPKRVTLGTYKPFSIYPFMLRDLALWTPNGTESADVAALITTHAGPLLARVDEFDRFEKDGRISYAFRLVFESMEKTLTDEEVNEYVEKVTDAAKLKGYEPR